MYNSWIEAGVKSKIRDVSGRSTRVAMGSRLDLVAPPPCARPHLRPLALPHAGLQGAAGRWYANDGMLQMRGEIRASWGCSVCDLSSAVMH